VLWEAEGITQVELAQRMMMEKASLTAVLAAMESKHLIARERNSRDRRKVNIFLTPAGRRMKEKVLPIAATINKRATRGLSAAQARELRELLTKVMANFGT
jgi:DNA-binding MarR family transcriptional regulator